MKNSILFLLLFAILVSCTHNLKVESKELDIDNLLMNSINDFSNINRLVKFDSVFIVSVEKDESNNLLVISISSPGSKLLHGDEPLVGTFGKLPSGFIILNSKLFYWRNERDPLSKEALDAYKSYDILQYDEGGRITLGDVDLDGSKKGAHYYYCDANRRVSKRVITNIAAGYYVPPKLNCN